MTPKAGNVNPSISLTRASDQEHLVRSLAQEIDALKAGRVELEEYVKIDIIAGS